MPRKQVSCLLSLFHEFLLPVTLPEGSICIRVTAVHPFPQTSMSPFLPAQALFTEGRDNWEGQPAGNSLGGPNLQPWHVCSPESTLSKPVLSRGNHICIPSEMLLEIATLVCKVIEISLVNKSIDLLILKIRKECNNYFKILFQYNY